MIRRMGGEDLFIIMELAMKEFGKMICSMAKVKKYGLTEPNIKENILWAKSMDKDATNGAMVPNTKANGSTIKSAAKYIISQNNNCL